ncbi:E-selectin [Elgaria multicarinata webbii]|uniref:E-selectin n=1 Tax=Elgaria multicarinata webbii TaxID=159646 RepID=UPI002FCCEEE2
MCSNVKIPVQMSRERRESSSISWNRVNSARPAQVKKKQQLRMNAFWFLPIIIYGFLLFKDSTCWTYNFSPKNMTYNYTEAEKWCKTYFTHLVAIQNKEEIDYLNANIDRGNYWIGIRKINKKWRWVGTNKPLTEEAKNWARGEPNNRKKNEDCVEIYIQRYKDAGKWNDEDCRIKKKALCYTVITCDRLKEPDQGTLECSHPVKNFSYNSSCNIKCLDGYKSTGLEPVVCTHSGDWSAPTPLCKVVECPVLQNPANGSFNCSHPLRNSWNSSCNFACEEGFLLKGSNRLQCSASGEWDGQEPECEAVKCKAIPQPERGFVNCSHDATELTFNSTCEFVCMEGYTLRGSPQIQCSSTGHWSDSIPGCEVVECRELQPPAHGFLNCSHPAGNFAWNTSCKFDCKEGFDLKGSSVLQCGASGKWDGQEPECEAVKCEVVQQPEGGFVNCSQTATELTFNSTCNFFCMEGYTLRGSPQIQCSSMGQWSEPIPKCEKAPQAWGSYLTIGPAAIGASFLSVGSFLIWLIKRLRRKAKTFTPARECFKDIYEKISNFFIKKKRNVYNPVAKPNR